MGVACPKVKLLGKTVTEKLLTAIKFLFSQKFPTIVTLWGHNIKCKCLLFCVIDEILYSVYWCMIKTSLHLHAGFYYNNNTNKLCDSDIQQNRCMGIVMKITHPHHTPIS